MARRRRRVAANRRAASPAPRRTYRERARSFFGGGKSFLEGFKPLEMLLFGVGGYELGNVLTDSGITATLYHMYPQYQNFADNLWGMFNGGQPAQGWGAYAIAKGTGLAGFVATMTKAASKGGLTGGWKNAILPFSVGAMLDPPARSGNGHSSQGAW